MTRFAIDPPTLLELVGRPQSIAPEHGLVAPNALRSQALDLLLAQVRAGDLEEARALSLHEEITRLKVRLLGDRVSRRTAWDLARERGWTIAEAEYVAVARLQADAFVTVDAGFAEKAAGVVPFAPLSDLYPAT